MTTLRTTPPLFTPSDRRLAQAVSKLAFCNPFLPERIAFEREVLGEDFVESDGVWSLRVDAVGPAPNVAALGRRAEALVARAGERLARSGGGGSPARTATPVIAEDLQLFEDAVLYVLYHRFEGRFLDLVLHAPERAGARPRVGFYGEYLSDAERLLAPAAGRLPTPFEPAHVFACLFQVRRAFHQLFAHIAGGSMPTARLRAGVWQSMFTHDMRRYRRTLFDKMGDLTTLVTGPTGTGKELVARAIGLSRFIPFDPRTQAFADGFAEPFHALNLSALSPALIESELFGHMRGSFTGARADRKGWLEVCRPLGTVFLDEIGDLDASLQVKLLRVLQARTFQRIGDTETRRFHGKVIAATNRDLAREMRAGRFREDFYYRLCSDILVTPSLREQLRESPGELRNLVRFLARRMLGADAEADGLAAEVEDWIGKRLGTDYAWPGNVRELEQCVRNVLIRREYLPPAADPHDSSGAPAGGAGGGTRERLWRGAAEGTLSADELLRRYCSLVYAQAGSYEEASRRLGLDRRTVKARVDARLVEELRGGPGGATQAAPDARE
ncbi:MAG: sigma-54-dependent Fis family transcriptional regulator [Planctomycetes bacterium]|nr:sigma-54-dependent Fis family transcriptional regulator [Planctomycetota bacterium]